MGQNVKPRSVNQLKVKWITNQILTAVCVVMNQTAKVIKVSREGAINVDTYSMTD